MSIMPIGFPSPFAATPTAGLPAATGAEATSESFAGMLTKGIENVGALQANAEGLAVQAATGDLKDIHSYTIAATQAQLATELTVAFRNKAVEAFTEIMRMPV